MSVKIYGHGDDLIEINGTGSRAEIVSDEFPGGNESMFVVLHPTKDVFTVTYGRGTDAVWVVEHVEKSGKLDVRIDRAPEGFDPSPHTDVAVVDGPVNSVECWPSWPPRADHVADRIERMFEDGSWFDERITDDKVMRIWAILNEPGRD